MWVLTFNWVILFPEMAQTALALETSHKPDSFMPFQAKHFLPILLGSDEEALDCTPFLTTFLCFTPGCAHSALLRDTDLLLPQMSAALNR